MFEKVKSKLKDCIFFFFLLSLFRVIIILLMKSSSKAITLLQTVIQEVRTAQHTAECGSVIRRAQHGDSENGNACFSLQFVSLLCFEFCVFDMSRH